VFGDIISGWQIAGLHGMSTLNTDGLDAADGRTITVPVASFPRLAHKSQTESANWRLIARGHGIHWPDLDEEISAESLRTGRQSRESGESLAKWIERRNYR
jgi:hypothetical protein